MESDLHLTIEECRFLAPLIAEGLREGWTREELAIYLCGLLRALPCEEAEAA